MIASSEEGEEERIIVWTSSDQRKAKQSGASKSMTACVTAKRMIALLHVIHLFVVHHKYCHALAHSPPSKIISRKSDGQYITYSFDTSGVDVDGPGSGEASMTLMHRQKVSVLDPSSTMRRVRSALISTFLPSIPSNQVDDSSKGNNNQLDKLRSSGYLKYILYDNIQDLSTSLRSVLATQRILEGVGVGRAGATALSATLNFILRDGCGMVASLLFTSYAARGFRRNVKRWKFFADIMVDVGITLEILAPCVLTNPRLQGWFLPLLCLGNICKALCGVAAGACGGAIQMYWAVKVMGTEDGISEVAAKGGAQRTVVGGLGLVLSALVAKRLGSSDVQTFIGLYCLLTILHLATNHRALQLVSLDWLNDWRLRLIVQEFLAFVNKGEDTRKNDEIVLSNPVETSKQEPLLFVSELNSIEVKYPIRMGVSFNELSQLSYTSQSLLHSHLTKRINNREDNYMLSVGRHSKGRHNILVSYFSNCSNSAKAKAYLHCCLVRRALAALQTNKHDYDEVDVVYQAEQVARSELYTLWPLFERCVTAVGWKLDKTECSTSGYEIYFEE